MFPVKALEQAMIVQHGHLTQLAPGALWSGLTSPPLLTVDPALQLPLEVSRLHEYRGVNINDLLVHLGVMKWRRPHRRCWLLRRSGLEPNLVRHEEPLRTQRHFHEQQ